MVHTFSLALYEGFALASSDSWPGLVGGAPSEAELAEALPRSIAEFAAWLESHGEAGPEAEPWAFSERLQPAQTALAGGEFSFAADRLPFSGDSYQRSLRHLGMAAADLAAASALPEALLDWLPQGIPLEHPDPWAPDPRTIRGIVTHALQLEVYYRHGLRDGPAAGIFERVTSVGEEHERTLSALAALSEIDRSRIFHSVRPSRGEPDEWTARKVLRRLISHHRAHTAEILQRRTWLLLGVPKP